MLFCITASLAQGLFATPGSYDALLRFSTLPGDVFENSASVLRGLAINLFAIW